MQFPDSRILIFAKAPEAGRVKTRLIAALGAQGAADFYRRLLDSTVERAAGALLAPVECCCTPTVEHAVFSGLAARHGVALTLQSGDDLGARMQNSAQHALAGCSSLLLIGADCPALLPRHMARALHWLRQGQDAVLGPAEDGGYVLLGLKQAPAELFSDIPWGSSRVLEMTRQRLQRLGWRWRELEPLWDVDRPEDLARIGHSSSDDLH